MGLADRDYARRPAGGGGGSYRAGAGVGFRGWRFWSISTWLIVINVGVFVLGGLVPGPIEARVMPVGAITPEGTAPSSLVPSGDLQVGSPVEARRALVDPANPGVAVGAIVYRIFPSMFDAWGHFSTERGFRRLEVWRLVTFQFLHANLIHLLFNMLGIFFFGRLVEDFLGRKRFAAFYLACGIGGGLLYLALNGLGALGLDLPGVLNINTMTPLVGASAGVFGIIIAAAYIEPNRVIQLLIPPVPLKMKWFAYGYVAIALFNLISGGSNAGGDAAHVGGAAAGFVLIRRPHLLRDFFDVFGNSNLPNKNPRSPRRARGSSAPAASEVDKILDKVAREGIHSLTEAEKKTLARASEDRRAAS